MINLSKLFPFWDRAEAQWIDSLVRIEMHDAEGVSLVLTIDPEYIAQALHELRKAQPKKPKKQRT